MCCLFAYPSVILPALIDAQVSDLTEKAQRLSNFLWSRKRKVEDAQLRAKAMALEKALWSASQEHPTGEMMRI